MAVVVLAAFSVIIATNAGYMSNALNTEPKTQVKNASTTFYANISIRLYEGDGCGCVPLRGITINATSRDTDHYTSGITDENGLCVLQLEFDKTYRISIQDAYHESVLFDFVVIDDQAFSFHTKIVQSSSVGTFLQMFLHKLFPMKKIIP